ncbi:major facilitator superfamily transporter [Penicillium capsulatum]|uniref:Major facilitator superfamily transporter n=1 Tax=Penicillium capsulatum TaxID=69766 RepID=A0A9W9HLH2_9EURO|nr:major facilitator superfamily transporter [Penicillium capsulatum]KAJ6112452.1 major facilitator superfamily transporter [Penicillium capsulatum]
MAATHKVEIIGNSKNVETGELSDIQISPDEDKKLLRKIDRCLLPVMAVSYMFQFLDKSALSFTAILGLRSELHLNGSEFSWANGIYYFGYLIATSPAGFIMVRWPVGKTIASAILFWGCVLMLTAVCHNAAGLLATRFFLGAAEAPIAPGLSVVVSMWYKRSEQPLRHAAWFLGNTCAGIFGGLLAYGIGHIESIAPWKAVFLIFGAVTTAWSFGIFFLLPDTPSTSWFLSPVDREKAIMRVKENKTGIKNDDFKWSQCREALLDVKAWFLVIIQLSSNIPNGGEQSFGTIVVEGFGFGTLNSLLLQCVKYLVQGVFVLMATAGSSYFHNTRTYWMAWNFAIAILGTALVRELPEHLPWGRFAGYCLAVSFGANFPLMMSLVSGNFGGFTKKVTVNAMVFTAYCAGNIVGPQLFFGRESPSYPSGFLSIMICFGVGLVSSFLFRLYLIWENRRRDRLTDPTAPSERFPGTCINLLDKTDKEIPEFRYVY